MDENIHYTSITPERKIERREKEKERERERKDRRREREREDFFFKSL